MTVRHFFTVPLGLNVSLVISIDPTTATAQAYARDDFYREEIEMTAPWVAVVDAILQSWLLVAKAVHLVGSTVREYICDPAWTASSWREVLGERLAAVMPSAEEAAVVRG